MPDNEPTPDAKRDRSPVVIAVAVVLLPALYVLSLGPYVWLLRHGYIDHGFNERFFWRFYAPIRLLENSSEAFHDLLYRYLQIWGQP